MLDFEVVFFYNKSRRICASSRSFALFSAKCDICNWNNNIDFIYIYIALHTRCELLEKYDPEIAVGNRLIWILLAQLVYTEKSTDKNNNIYKILQKSILWLTVDNNLSRIYFLWFSNF